MLQYLATKYKFIFVENKTENQGIDALGTTSCEGYAEMKGSSNLQISGQMETARTMGLRHFWKTNKKQ